MMQIHCQWREELFLAVKRWKSFVIKEIRKHSHKMMKWHVIKEFKSDYSQRIQLFHCHRDLNRYLQNAKKKSLPNKIVSVFGHQNWSVLIYLRWIGLSLKDFNVCDIKWLKKISRNCKTIFSGDYGTKIDRNEIKSIKIGVDWYYN